MNATDWFLKLRDGNADANTRRQFVRWLEEDYDHVVDFERCELAIELTRKLEADPQLKALMDSSRQMAEHHRAKVENARNRFWRRPGLRFPLAAAAVAMAATVVLAVVTLLAPTRYETEIGEQRTIVADDESVLVLNTNTLLKVDFDKHVRRVWLERGQAYFSVAKDPARPFEVIAHRGIVRATGTEFDVSTEGHGYGQVTVTVLEGGVDVLPGRTDDGANSGAGMPALVAVGEAVTYWRNGAIAQVSPADLEEVTAWRQGKLDFSKKRLADALAEHNRYSRRKIVVGDDELKDLRISGVFRIGDTEGFLFLLKESLGLTAFQQADFIVLIPKRKLREANQKPTVAETNPG